MNKVHVLVNHLEHTVFKLADRLDMTIIVLAFLKVPFSDAEVFL